MAEGRPDHRPARLPAGILLLLGVLLLAGALALRVEAGSVAIAGGTSNPSAPLAFLVDHVAAPLARAMGDPDPGPAKVAGTLSIVLWVGMALGLLVAAVGVRLGTAHERREAQRGERP